MQRRDIRGSDWDALNFQMELMTYWSADQVGVIDESSKDRRAFWRPHGYGPVGGQTFDYEPYLTRGGRVSALAFFSTFGFEDWRYTHGTYDGPRWRAHMRDILFKMRPDGTKLADKFRVLILDLATTHTCDEDFMLELRAHMAVRLIPAKRHELSPLDNGGFGWIVRFLQANNHLYAQQDIRVGMDAGMRSMPPAAARMCFHNCKYF